MTIPIIPVEEIKYATIFVVKQKHHSSIFKNKKPAFVLKKSLLITVTKVLTSTQVNMEFFTAHLATMGYMGGLYRFNQGMGCQ